MFLIQRLKDISFETESPEEQNYYFPVEGTDGKGIFTIHADCQVLDSSRSCQITKCYLEVGKSQTISEEKYLGKQLIIYDRQKHGPLKFEQNKE